jgi:integrase/recombinase XerD
MPSIYVRGQIEGKWRYSRVKTGRGQRTGQLQPPFYIRPFRDGKQSWHTLGAQTFEAALEEADQVDAGLVAKSHGLTVAELEANPNRITLVDAVEEFLKNAEASKKSKTLNGYRLNLDQFRESCPQIRFLDQVDIKTLRAFRDWLKAKGYDPRTLHNRLLTILSLLKDHKISTGFSLKQDLPTYEENPPVPFTDEDLKKLFAVMDDEEQLRYKFFLGTAAREQEVQYATWQDINFEKMEFHVRAKKDVGFTPKNHETRAVPMPKSLVALLKERKKNAPHSRWIFVNGDGKPEGHFLKKLKRLALKAGINCGECVTTVNKGRYDAKRPVEVSCKTDPVCEHIFLHRLRKTCASRWEASNIPVRTIQAWLGHKSLETTMLYLGVANSAKYRGNIDEAFGD